VHSVTKKGNHYVLMEGSVGHKTDDNDVMRANIYIKHGSNTKVQYTALYRVGN
jgi:hypothetical protein